MNTSLKGGRIIYTGSTELNSYIHTGVIPESTSPNLTNQSVNLYHYDSSKSIVTTDDLEGVSAQFALFFKNQDLIKVPAKTTAVLNKYMTKGQLYDIHPDRDTAIELCLLFLSNLTNTFFTMRDTNDEYEKLGWKRLKAQILNEQLTGIKFESDTRKNIIAALTEGTSKGIIVECDGIYSRGHHSFSYRLGPAYLAKGTEKYEVKTKHVKQLLNKAYFKSFSEMIENPICKNLINIYGSLELPNQEEIIAEAKRLVKEKKKTKKQKTLTFLNKHTRAYFKDANERSFIEEDIEKYNFLTDNGFLVPRVTGENNGGRIVDSITLMPSWIRNLIKKDGQLLTESDYSALHPNIAMSLYGGSKEFLKHEDVSKETNLDEKEVKKAHLSFFNMEYWQMKQSPLFDYYNRTEPEMMKIIIKEKLESEKKYKTTSMRMFKKEVEIMTEVVVELNKIGIFVLYIYDALMCTEQEKPSVINMMNTITLKHGVKTTAK